MKKTNFRKIYEIEAINLDGKILVRRYAANKKTAKRISKPYSNTATIRLTQKEEHEWINPRDVERI